MVVEGRGEGGRQFNFQSWSWQFRLCGDKKAISAMGSNPRPPACLCILRLPPPSAHLFPLPRLSLTGLLGSTGGGRWGVGEIRGGKG